MKPMTSGERRPAYRATPTVPQAVAVAVLKRGSGQLERNRADCVGLAHHENLTTSEAPRELNGGAALDAAKFGFWVGVVVGLGAALVVFAGAAVFL